MQRKVLKPQILSNYPFLNEFLVNQIFQVKIISLPICSGINHANRALSEILKRVLFMF